LALCARGRPGSSSVGDFPVARGLGAPPLLKLDGVGYHPATSDVPLLRDCNLEVEDGTLTLIYGRSGSGKTTLLELLAGLNPVTQGSVLLRGRPVEGSAALTGVSGIVFQFPDRYFVGDTIAQELLFGQPRRAPGGAPDDAVVRRCQDALGAVGMDGISPRTSPMSLSGGYKRRLALAVQLVRMPQVLLLDEPLAGLDYEARDDVVTLLRDLKRRCALVVVSHDLEELWPLADKRCRMLPGGLLSPGQDDLGARGGAVGSPSPQVND